MIIILNWILIIQDHFWQIKNGKKFIFIDDTFINMDLNIKTNIVEKTRFYNQISFKFKKIFLWYAQ